MLFKINFILLMAKIDIFIFQVSDENRFDKKY